MNNKSWRHHYLPEFYVAGFTKESGKVKIYNVLSNSFVKHGKEFSPTSFFFEKNANTIKKNDVEYDFLEGNYASFDSEISRVIAKINNSDNSNRFNVTEDDMPKINHFISLMYWRLPQNKERLIKFITDSDSDQLGLTFKNKDGKRDFELEEQIRLDTEFVKLYRYYNSIMDTLRGGLCRTPYTIIPKIEQFPYICSDNPIIFKDNLPEVYNDDYIFPLTGKRLFIKANIQSNLPNYVWLFVDSIILCQAEKFVSVTDEKYIDILNNWILKRNFTLDSLKLELFEILNNAGL